MRGFNILKAKEMFLNMLKWREDCSVDAIANVCSVFIVCYISFISGLLQEFMLTVILELCSICTINAACTFIAIRAYGCGTVHISLAGILLWIKLPSSKK